jgi:hypothetical protein
MGGDASDMGGPSTRYSPSNNGAGGGGNSHESSFDNGQSRNKRKAQGSHRMGMGNSISSQGSSKRGSPSRLFAPTIKVEGDSDEGGMVDGATSSKGQLKAVMKQRSNSRTGGNASSAGIPTKTQPVFTHHQSYSVGNMEAMHYSKDAMLNPAAMARNGSISPRPYTAGAMSSGMQSPSPNTAIHPQQSAFQQISPNHFAYASDPSALPHGATSSLFLRPQGWGETGTSPQLMRSTSASALTNSGLTYGDLASGGVPSPSGSPYRTHATLGSTNQAINAAQNYASLQSPQQQMTQSSLLPLAHPILKQHPQYESYTNQLRLQSQQHQRNSSQPSISVHTAPSSPNHSNLDGFQNYNPNGTLGGLNLPSSIQPTKRSASFGYTSSQAAQKREFQDTVQSNQFSFLDTFDGDKTNSHKVNNEYAMMNGHGSAMPPPSPYGQVSDANGSAGGTRPQDVASQTPISNAAFNDLMGSILSDMGSSTTGTSATSGDDHRARDNFKEQEDVIRSMESDGSLTTLVNNESFDALMTNGIGNTSKSDASSTDFPVKDYRKVETSKPQSQTQDVSDN